MEYAGNKGLPNSSRLVHSYLEGVGQSLMAIEISDGLGMPLKTVRYGIDILVNHGLVESDLDQRIIEGNVHRDYWRAV